MKTDTYSFASDNCAGVHPKVMEALAEANQGYVHSYGDDVYTAEAVKLIKSHFGKQSAVFFVYNGTGANVTGITHLVHSYQTVICAETGHIHVDECGSLEHYCGCKVVALPTEDGKITPDDIAPRLVGIGDEHRSQPGMISITQPTEYGVLYTVDEIMHLSEFARANHMLLHMDGARIANAAAALSVPLKAFTTDCGVDVLSFGVTKNGIMFGESVVFLKKGLEKAFPYIRKQGMQLHSKMRFIASQFIAILTDNLWLENARHANEMMRRLYQGITQMPAVTITRPVHCNALFALMPKEVIDTMQQQFHFYTWNEQTGEVRLMTSYQTTESEVDKFLEALQKQLDYKHSESI
ncbi:MAG: low specificity L-threonine aldolase [Bacillota bacterium]|nr:low specificity L-threonine aldolase [Bacillota bacterium]MDW7677845.1 low specificity L-threonine aldolase [Bacillota bacterium]